LARSYKDARAKELLDLGNHLFDKRKPKDSLDQEIAWNFCPDLAEFQSPLELGEDWAADRMDGYPEQVSRELSNQLGANLRPNGKQWFKSSTGDDEQDADEANARFLEYLGRTIRREIYKPQTGFVGATKELDRFYVNFGQGVMSIEESPTDRDHLYFRNHHIKDCVWLDNQLGQVDHLHRRAKMSARAMRRMFGEKRLHETIVKAAKKEPNREFEIRYITMPTEEYNTFGEEGSGKGASIKLPFVCCVIDVENCCIIKEGGLPTFNYVVPRWQRLAGTQYAFSPATMAALADGRMAQMLSQILLESGEKAIDPPMIGKQEAVIGQPNIAAGGLSWVDMDHEAKLTDALDVIKLDADMRVAFQMRADLRELLAKAFFIDKLTLPEASMKEMTAFEVSRRLEEHVRNLLPIFEPIQVEYNARMLDIVFALLVNMKKIDFGRMPDGLSDVDTMWQFETPIQTAESRLLVEQFLDTCNVLTVGAQTEAAVGQAGGTIPIHFDKGMRDAVRGVGGPAAWRKTQEERDADAEASEQALATQETMAMVGTGAGVAEQVGKAGQSLGLITPPGKAAAAQGGAGAPAQVPQGAGPATTPMPLPGGGQANIPAGIDMGGALAALGGGAGGGSEDMVASLSAEVQELRMMLRRMAMQMSNIEDAVTRPKKVRIDKDKNGKITGASISSGGRDIIEGIAA
jgi:hypothetical protein